MYFFRSAIQLNKMSRTKIQLEYGTVNSTSDYTLKTLYRSYFKGISANSELQVYSVTCC
jgi:hypothetical protein